MKRAGVTPRAGRARRRNRPPSRHLPRDGPRLAQSPTPPWQTALGRTCTGALSKALVTIQPRLARSTRDKNANPQTNLPHTARALRRTEIDSKLGYNRRELLLRQTRKEVLDQVI